MDSNAVLTREKPASTQYGHSGFSVSSIMDRHYVVLNKQTGLRFLFFSLEIFVWVYCNHCSTVGLFLWELLFLYSDICCFNISSIQNNFSPGFYDFIPNVTIGFSALQAYIQEALGSSLGLETGSLD
jgi:hypothetical protein